MLQLSFAALPLVVLFIGRVEHHIDVLCDVAPSCTVPVNMIFNVLTQDWALIWTMGVYFSTIWEIYVHSCLEWFFKVRTPPALNLRLKRPDLDRLKLLKRLKHFLGFLSQLWGGGREGIPEMPVT